MLSKTDLMLQEEQNKILANRNKLEVGSEYTYKKMCEILEIKYISGGRQKELQLSRLLNYIEYEKNKAKFKITRNNLTKKEVAVKKTNSKFKDLDNVLLFKFADIIINTDKRVIEMNMLQAIEFTEMVSQLFSDMSKKIYTHNQLAIATNTEETDVEKIMTITRYSLLDKFEEACKRLQKRGLIHVRKVKMVRYTTPKIILDDDGKPILELIDKTWTVKQENDVTIRELDDNEISMLLDAQNEVIEEMGYKSMYGISSCGQFDKFKKRVCGKLGYDNYWNVYHIALSRYDGDNGILGTLAKEIDETKENLRALFKKSIDETKQTVKPTDFGSKPSLERNQKLTNCLIDTDARTEYILKELKAGKRIEDILES